MLGEMFSYLGKNCGIGSSADLGHLGASREWYCRREGNLSLLVSCLGCCLFTGEHGSDGRHSEMLLCPWRSVPGHDSFRILM